MVVAGHPGRLTNHRLAGVVELEAALAGHHVGDGARQHAGARGKVVGRMAGRARGARSCRGAIYRHRLDRHGQRGCVHGCAVGTYRNDVAARQRGGGERAAIRRREGMRGVERSFVTAGTCPRRPRSAGLAVR